MADKFSVAKDAYSIDYEALYKEGVRALLFDIDYTLVPHGAPADERASELIKKLAGRGFQILFVSNNNKDRAEMFAKGLPARCVTGAMKPLPKGYAQAVKLTGLKKEQVVLIGDQLFTDVLGARLYGLRAILTGRVDTERELSLKVKSKIEKGLFLIYNRDK